VTGVSVGREWEQHETKRCGEVEREVVWQDAAAVVTLCGLASSVLRHGNQCDKYGKAAQTQHRWLTARDDRR